MDFTGFIKDRVICLDGGMGTMLLERGLAPGECPEALSLRAPELVEQVHLAYLQAGSQVIYTNTFGANRLKLAHAGITVEQAVEAGVTIARKAAGNDALVALDIGPIGELLEPMGTLTFEQAYDLFAEQIRQGVKAGAQLIVIESMADLYEVKAALLAAKENSNLPVVCTMTFEANMRTYTGCHVSAMAVTLEALGADAVGINCSLGPVQLLPVARQLTADTNLPLVAKPNAGLPVVRDGVTCYDIDSTQFAQTMAQFVEAGVSLVGGCCGTNPEYIAFTAQAVEGLTPTKRGFVDITRKITTPSKLVEWSEDTHVGRVSAVANTEDAADTATELLYDGAEAAVLELPEGGAQAAELVKTVQACANLPLIFEAHEPQALEAALRCCNGRPGITATTAEEPALAALGLRYGAAVIDCNK